MKLKDVLMNYRIENFLSQREFAKKCGLSNSLISILEMGVNPQTGKKMSPDFETYKKLADGMNITLQSLFDMIGDSEEINLGRRYATDEMPEDIPKHDDVRLLIRGLNKLSPEQLEQATNMMRIMFAKYADYFTKEETDDDA